MYETRVSKACAEVEAARLAVQNATKQYARGGSLDALNTANRRLADAQQASYEVAANRVPDDR